MANAKKTRWLVYIKATNKEGKTFFRKGQFRSRERLAQFEEAVRTGDVGWKTNPPDLKIVSYEIWLLQHMKKVSVRRSKKCDG